MQALVPTFLLPVIPDQTMSSSPSYQNKNTRLPASPFQMMWPSPRMLLTTDYSSIYRNLTPTNLKIIMPYLHLLQSAPLGTTIYANTHQLISSSSYISAITPVACTITSLVCYCINGLSGRNLSVDFKNLRKFSLFKTDTIVMKNLEATTQLGGFNQSLPTRQSNKRFPYSGPH